MATVSAYPVLLKNRTGVFGSLVVTESSGTVDELIALLNSQLAAASTDDDLNVVDVVHSIGLYGVQLEHTRRLAPLLFEQSCNSPRLVAYTMRCPKLGYMQRLHVRMLTGKEVTVTYDSRSSVHDVKQRIQEQEGIPPDQQRLIFAGKQLEDKVSMFEYGIQTGSTVHLVLRLRGGYVPPKIFADVSDGSLLQQHEFSNSAPAWRVCSTGINIEGRCASPTCKAFNQMVISPQGFKAFNLIEDTHAACPLCKTSIKPVTCGFYDCTWKFEGVQEKSDHFISSPWKEALGEKYHRFDADQSSGSVSWKSLLIVVRAATISQTDQEGTTSSKEDELCAICWADGGGFETTRCGHRFHPECSMQWSEWCKASLTCATCPLCRVSL